MDRKLIERLLGGAVLVILAVIFLPMLLDGEDTVERRTAVEELPLESGAPEPDPAGDRLTMPAEPLVSPLDETLPEASQPPEAAAPPPEPMPQESLDTLGPEPGQPDSPAVDGAREAPSQELPEADVAEQERDSVEDRGGWFVQLGSFSRRENAEVLRTQLEDAGYEALIHEGEGGRGAVYRVRAGPYADRGEAELQQAELAEREDLEGIVLERP